MGLRCLNDFAKGYGVPFLAKRTLTLELIPPKKAKIHNKLLLLIIGLWFTAMGLVGIKMVLEQVIDYML